MAGYPVSEEEKARVRHHLGFLEVQSAYTFGLGIPLNTQPQFMIEGAFNNLLASAYPKFVQLLCRLDTIENQVFCGSELADIESIDTIKVNRMRLKELAQYYKIAQQSLANLLGCPPNPWDMREWLVMSGGGLNGPII